MTLTAAEEYTLLQLDRLSTGPAIRTVHVNTAAVEALRRAGLVTAAGKLTVAGRARAAELQAGGRAGGGPGLPSLRT